MKKLLKNGNLHDLDQERLIKKDILIIDGKIAKIEDDIAILPDFETIDISGKDVIPGFIDPHTHIGMVQAQYSLFLADFNEYYSYSHPALNAIDGVYHLDTAFDDLRTYGVTTVCITPGSKNVFGGKVIAVKPYKNRVIDDMVIKNPIGLKCALGENPKRNSDKKNQHNSRMGNLYYLRKSLHEAMQYKRNNDNFDMDLEILKDVLDRKIPLRMHAHRSDDIISAIRLKKEFDLDMIIEHGTESYLVAEHLKKYDIPVILGPNLGAKSKKETSKRSWQAPIILKEKNVMFSFMTDYPVISSYLLPYSSGIYMRYGFTFYDALRAITINAARILGLDYRIGSVEIGKDADLLVYNGDPFHIGNMPELVLLEGEIVMGD